MIRLLVCRVGGGEALRNLTYSKVQAPGPCLAEIAPMPTLRNELPLNQLPSLGSGVSELVKAFPRLMPDVASFDFVTYQTGSKMLDEVESLAKREFARATDFTVIQPPSDPDRRSAWLNVLLEPFPEEAFEQVIALALRHRPSPPGFSLPARAVASGGFLSLLEEHQLSGAVLALTSRCRLVDGSQGHLPMLDFRCEPNDYFLHLLRVGLTRMVRGGGAFLRSGRSFHFYGFRPLDDDGWRRFMAQALLLAPLTDVRYIAHRLLDGFADLRLTTSSVKPIEPTVAAYLDT